MRNQKKNDEDEQQEIKEVRKKTRKYKIKGHESLIQRSERLMNEKSKRLDKIRKLKKKYEQEAEAKNCTFRPNINRSRKKRKIEDLLDWDKKVKHQKMKKELEKESQMNFKPQISKNSEIIYKKSAHKHSKSDVSERLYSMSKIKESRLKAREEAEKKKRTNSIISTDEWISKNSRLFEAPKKDNLRTKTPSSKSAVRLEKHESRSPSKIPLEKGFGSFISRYTPKAKREKITPRKHEYHNSGEFGTQANKKSQENSRNKKPRKYKNRSPNKNEDLRRALIQLDDMVSQKLEFSSKEQNDAKKDFSNSNIIDNQKEDNESEEVFEVMVEEDDYEDDITFAQEYQEHVKNDKNQPQNNKNSMAIMKNRVDNIFKRDKISPKKRQNMNNKSSVMKINHQEFKPKRRRNEIDKENS